MNCPMAMLAAVKCRPQPTAGQESTDEARDNEGWFEQAGDFVAWLFGC